MVGHHPAQEGKEEHRQGLERPHQAQVEGGVGEHQDQPAEGHGLHPGAGEGDHLAGVKQPEIAVAQGRKGGKPHRVHFSFPKSWRLVRITLLPGPGSDSRSWRRISQETGATP